VSCFLEVFFPILFTASRKMDPAPSLFFSNRLPSTKIHKDDVPYFLLPKALPGTFFGRQLHFPHNQPPFENPIPEGMGFISSSPPPLFPFFFFYVFLDFPFAQMFLAVFHQQPLFIDVFKTHVSLSLCPAPLLFFFFKLNLFTTHKVLVD